MGKTYKDSKKYVKSEKIKHAKLVREKRTRFSYSEED